MKRTRMSGYQPQYFPRLHYFNRVLESEVFEISDYVQFVKKHAYTLSDGTSKRGRSFQAHTIIKNDQGPLFLAVPTQGELLPINKTKIDYSKDWAKDHLKSIEISYKKAPNFAQFYPEIAFLLIRKYNSIAQLSLATISWSITRLITHEAFPMESFTFENVQKLLQREHPYRLKKIFLASTSPVAVPTKGLTNEWCIALCKYAEADEYMYGGTSQSAYMDLEKYAKAGIKPIKQNWTCPLYPQLYPKSGFISNLSVIDLVMNTTLKQSVKIMKGENTFPAIHPSKLIAVGAASLLEYETLLSMIDMVKFF
jgi:hypothetical protein